MRAVKNSIILGLMVALSGLISLGVNSTVERQNRPLIPNANKGGYTLINSGAKNNEELEIRGRVLDVDTSEPLIGSTIKIMCYESVTDSNGNYSIKIPLPANIEFFANCISLGYKPTRTNKIDLSKYAGIELDFYLEEDDQTIYHCD